MDLFSRLARFFPFLRWPRPTLATLRADAWAGITVGLVLVPQSLAYATLAGMPPHTGLYAALVPAVVGALWGSSPLLAVGPVALTSLLVFGALAPLAQPGSAQWVELAIWLALYAGLMQFALGAFRLGRIADLVSHPVVLGFINAAAVIIILTQLPALLGLSVPAGASWTQAHFDPATAAFGLAAVALLFLFRRFLPRLPGILIVTIVGIVASAVFGYAEAGGAVVGAIPAGLPAPVLPSAIPFDVHRQLLPAALILALVSFTEAMSSCRALARRRNEQWDESQELVGQGMAKIAAAFSGAFPVSGSFSRSALNLYAGAVSAWSTLFATACVLLSLLFLTEYLYDLPFAVLAAIIIVPVLNLIDVAGLRRLLKVSRNDGVVALVTFAATLAALPDLYWGVAAGVGLNMVVFLYRRMHPRIIEVALHPDGTLRDSARFGLPRLAPDVIAVRMDSALNFLTGNVLERFVLGRCREDRSIRRVLLCSNAWNDIDASGIDTLEALRFALEVEGVELYVSAVKIQVWSVMDRAGFAERLGKARVFATDREAVDALSGEPDASTTASPAS
ncbi:MAG TPA: SulP family inorganic anion transporter [Noviherbaspirillum sp.]|nr:SulP family inorganic anion transporter [Noviherbaspirillum sp.]